MNKIFITTMNESLYERYGHKLLDTYIQTKQTIPLYIYTEKFENPPTIDNVFWVDLNSKELNGFIERNKHRRIENYMFDGTRFCYKVFAQFAAKNLAEKVFFLDADCIFLNTIPETWFDKILPDDCFTSFYDRPGMYTECGFVGFNCKLPVSEYFFKEYLNLYLTDGVYKLNYFTDCHAFDFTRSKFVGHVAYKERKLGQFTQHKIIHVMQYDPEINHYIDHKKGNRKYTE